jgi:hypothetical protein
LQLQLARQRQHGCADGLNQSQAGADRALGIVLMGVRVTKVYKHAVAHVFGDEALEPRDNFCAAIVVDAQHVTHVFGVEPRREHG